MPTFSEQLTIAAPQDAVWNALADERLPLALLFLRLGVMEFVPGTQGARGVGAASPSSFTQFQ